MVTETKRQALEVLADWVVPALLILAIPIAAAFYVQDRNAKDLLYRNQIQACHRGNELRAALGANEQALEQFITDAYNIRSAQAAAYRAAGNIMQADLNQAAADSYLETKNSLQTIDKVDCVATIRKH